MGLELNLQSAIDSLNIAIVAVEDELRKTNLNTRAVVDCREGRLHWKKRGRQWCFVFELNGRETTLITSALCNKMDAVNYMMQLANAVRDNKQHKITTVLDYEKKAREIERELRQCREQEWEHRGEINY